jgi:hypothetical protein
VYIYMKTKMITRITKTEFDSETDL